MMRARRLTTTLLATLGAIAGALMYTSAPVLASEGSVGRYTTLPSPAAVTNVGVSEVTSNTATLSGTVDPEGSGLSGEDTRWCFEYGTDTSYNLGYLPEIVGDAGAGSSGVPVSVQLTGLEPGVTYYYRLVAVNAIGIAGEAVGCHLPAGQQSASADRQFTTPIFIPAPAVATGAASGVSQNSATISGTVDPDGYRTSYAFQVGIDTSYGAEVFGEAGAGTETQTFSVDLLNLQPGTTYHYRLVASNQGATIYGADATFTTPVFPSASLSAPVPDPLIATPTLTFPAAPTEASTGTQKTAQVKHKQKTAKGKSKGKKKGGKASKAARHHDSRRQERGGR